MKRALVLLLLVASCAAPAAPQPLGAARLSPPPYSRAAWSTHWIDADHDCQSTREEILIAQSSSPAVLDVRGCHVVSGTWFDPYTGETFTDPRALDIDHVVPLANAHASGGWRWTAESRQAFANDLAHHELQAVSAHANRSKGDSGPDAWLPPNAAYRCTYVRTWVAIKKLWKLAISAAEARAIAALRCGAVP